MYHKKQQKPKKKAVVPYNNRKYKRYVKKKVKDPTSSTTTFARQLIIGDRYMTKLRYTNSGTPSIGLTAAAYNSHSWIMNGLYDTDPSFGTGPIAGFTELTALYSRYIVNAVKFRVTACNPSSSSYLYMMVQASFTSSSPGSWTIAREYVGNDKVWQCMIEPLGGNSTGTLEGYINLGALFGNPTTYKADHQYQGTSSANPTTVCYLQVVILEATGTSITATVPVSVEVTPYCEFFQRVELIT